MEIYLLTLLRIPLAQMGYVNFAIRSREAYRHQAKLSTVSITKEVRPLKYLLLINVLVPRSCAVPGYEVSALSRPSFWSSSTEYMWNPVAVWMVGRMKMRSDLIVL